MRALQGDALVRGPDGAWALKRTGPPAVKTKSSAPVLIAKLGETVIELDARARLLNLLRRLTEAFGGVREVAARAKDATSAQLALAWLLKRSPVMLPIPGTSKVAHLEENVAAVDVSLSDEEFSEIDRAARRS